MQKMCPVNKIGRGFVADVIASGQHNIENIEQQEVPPFIGPFLAATDY